LIGDFLGTLIVSELKKDFILFVHRMLIGGIDDSIAGRFCGKGEYVRVGTPIAPAPEFFDWEIFN